MWVYGKKRKIKILRTQAQKALWFIESYGLEISGLTAMSDAGQRVNLNCTKPEERQKEKQERTFKNLSEKEEDVEKVLYLMDKFCAGNQVYHELVLVSIVCFIIFLSRTNYGQLTITTHPILY